MIGELPTYVARPETGTAPLGVVVIIPDAFGWELLNTRALADAYAQRIPAVVMVPEFMDGARDHFASPALWRLRTDQVVQAMLSHPASSNSRTRSEQRSSGYLRPS